MRLLVISDTYMEIYKGQVMAYSPVLKELESIQDNFIKITWIGMADNRRNQSAISVGNFANIEYKILPRLGGTSFYDKLRVLFHLPYLFFHINKLIRTHDVVHTRGPCLPAYIGVVLAFLYKNKIWFNKFATNWKVEKSSIAFKIHRKILIKSNFSKVTINGSWPGLPNHVLPFENPCLSEIQVELGRKVTNRKSFIKPFNLIFIGNIEKGKGIFDLVEALARIESAYWCKLYIIGNGIDLKTIEPLIKPFDEKIILVGSVSSEKVHDYLSKSDFLLLPSQSEGFPKVLAEAVCWGCIPITSDVGSIPQFISHGVNGFLWNLKGSASFGAVLSKALSLEHDTLKKISEKANSMSDLFTYGRYSKRIREEILL